MVKRYVGILFSALCAAAAVLLCLMLILRRGNTPPPSGAPTTQADAAPVTPALQGPPVITGVRDFEVRRGGALALRAGVNAADARGGALPLEVNGDVDTNEPGEYTVVYSATDELGQTVRVSARVTVRDAELDAVYELADPILEKILKDGMTDAEKAKAIHLWIQNNIAYQNTGAKESVAAGAYNALTLRRGDCYTYYAIAKVLLERAGIAAIDMARVETARRRHYWLLVDVGQGYRHFDATPVKQRELLPRGGFMLTEREARAFGRAIRQLDYYAYDPALLPQGVAVAE